MYFVSSVTQWSNYNNFGSENIHNSFLTQNRKGPLQCLNSLVRYHHYDCYKQPFQDNFSDGLIVAQQNSVSLHSHTHVELSLTVVAFQVDHYRFPFLASWKSAIMSLFCILFLGTKRLGQYTLIENKLANKIFFTYI